MLHINVCVCVLHQVVAEHKFSVRTDGKNILATVAVYMNIYRCVPEKVGINQKDVNQKWYSHKKKMLKQMQMQLAKGL